MNKKITFSNSYIESIEGIDYLSLREENYYKTGFAAGNLFLKSNYKIIILEIKYHNSQFCMISIIAFRV